MTDDTINDAMVMRGVDSTLGRIDQYELVRELGGGGFGTDASRAPPPTSMRLRCSFVSY